MAVAYTKDFLVEAFAYRFLEVSKELYESQLELAEAFYDKVGKDTFRVYASLDADALKVFKKYMAEI